MIIREDGYIFGGNITKKGKSYPVWRSPDSFARRAEHKRKKQIVAFLAQDEAEKLRSGSAARNKRRRSLKGEIIKQQNRQRYPKNRAAILKRNALWRKANWNKVLESRRKPQYAIAASLRVRIVSALKAAGASRAARTAELVGCSLEELRRHFEAQFKEGMSWENHGKWHIDHKRPCASFDLCDATEQRRCFHWSNLQPLWACENISKGAKTQATRP